MEQIVVEVDNQTAKAWHNTSAKLRTQIGKDLKRVLNDPLNNTPELYKDKEAILSLKLASISFYSTSRQM